MRCPWCNKEIEVKSSTIVRKVVKPFSDSRTKQPASPPKKKGKDRIEVVAPPIKPKAKKVKAKVKGKKR